MKKLLLFMVCLVAASMVCHGRLKLMSFNVRYNTPKDTGVLNWEVRKHAIKKMFDDVKPDVVCLNEPRAEMRVDIRKMLPDYDMIEIPNTGTRQGGNTQLIFNKNTIKLIKSGHFFLSSTPDEPSGGWYAKAAQWRGSVWGAFKEKATGKKFWFCGTHENLGRTFLDHAERINASCLNVDKMREQAGNNNPVFIVGDMNAPYGCDDDRCLSLQPFYYWMKAARDTAPITDTIPSFNGFGKVKPAPASYAIDHIYYRNAEVHTFETITKDYGVPYISDHYPIMITTDLK